jgi:hypothetical protein
MPSKRAKKAPKATIDPPRDDEPVYPPSATLNTPRDDETIYPLTLNYPHDDEPISPPSPLLLPLDCLPSPNPLDEPTIDANKVPQHEKAAALKWTAEMIKALVECIYGVWKDGRSADNGFKKEAWVEASNAVQRVYQGLLTIEWEKCKNKWTDLKEKWKHWLILSDMSGFGWDNEKERYEVDDYVWESLNKSHPRILWHKTHVMPYREIFEEVLHEA